MECWGDGVIPGALLNDAACLPQAGMLPTANRRLDTGERRRSSDSPDDFLFILNSSLKIYKCGFAALRSHGGMESYATFFV